MLKYNKPEMEIIIFDAEDIVRTSGEIDNIGGGSGQLPTPDIDYNFTGQP